jgi:hypothetical protein
MHVQSDKNLLSTTTDQQRSNNYGASISSNRVEAIAQRKLQEASNKSPQVRQLKAYQDMANARNLTINSNQPIQLKTQVFTQQDQTYNYDIGTVNVGSVMEVGLDPSDMKQGQSANINIGQNEMMDAIRAYWHINGGDVVKGHLLNDNLGGLALNNNLYPITRAANADHLNYVENAAKDFIWNKTKPIYYKVEVDANPHIFSGKADFKCEIRDWDPKTKNVGNLLFGPITIKSDLENVSAYNEAYDTNTGYSTDPFQRPKKPGWAIPPNKRVGDLSEQEQLDRMNQ